MDRTKIRRITAGAIATAALSLAAALAIPAIASGAEADPANTTTPMSVAQQRAVMHWELPRVRSLQRLRDALRHHNARHALRRASRSSFRAPLTGDPQTVAHALVLRRGWGEAGWSCVDRLWIRESHWNPYAVNHSSGAYGIPQALPATKMATAGADWRSNPLTQIRWGLDYIAAKYGTPCIALAHSTSYGFY